jgi:hypothetical protein
VRRVEQGVAQAVERQNRAMRELRQLEGAAVALERPA